MHRDTHYDDNHVLPTTIVTSIKPPTTTTKTSSEKKNLSLVNEEKIKATHEQEELNRCSVGNLIKLLGCRRNLQDAGRKGKKLGENS